MTTSSQSSRHRAKITLPRDLIPRKAGNAGFITIHEKERDAGNGNGLGMPSYSPSLSPSSFSTSSSISSSMIPPMNRMMGSNNLSSLNPASTLFLSQSTSYSRKQDQNFAETNSLSNSSASSSPSFPPSSTSPVQFPSIPYTSKKDSNTEFKEEIKEITYPRSIVPSNNISSSTSSSTFVGVDTVRSRNNTNTNSVQNTFTSHIHNPFDPNESTRQNSLNRHDSTSTIHPRPASTNSSNASNSSSTTPRTPRTLPKITSNSSDFTLITALTQRLADLEQQHSQALSKIKEQELSSKKWKNQCMEMDKFLSDYGLSWIGEQNQHPPANPDHEPSFKSESVSAKVPLTGFELPEPRHLNSIPNSSNEVTETAPWIPDIAQLRKCVKELNSSVTTSQMRFAKEQHGTAMRLLPPLTISLVLYSKGLKLHDQPFRSYSHPAVQAVFADILDNYFPAELKEAFPDGVLLEIIDKRAVDYLEDEDVNALFIPFSGMGVKVSGDVAGAEELSYRVRALRRAHTSQLNTQSSTETVKKQPYVHNRIRDGNVRHFEDRQIVVTKLPQISFVAVIPDSSMQLLIRVDSSSQEVIIIGKNETMLTLCKTLHAQYPKLISITIRLWPNIELGPISLRNLDESNTLLSPIETLGIKDKTVLRVRSQLKTIKHVL